MNPSTSNATAEPLLFSWDQPQRERLAIAAFFVLSLVAHAFCFYVFQVVYPPTVALLPPPARIGLITSNSEEARNVLRWIDAEDPALAFTTQLPADAKSLELPKAEHIPSYVSVQPMLKSVPPLAIDSRVPSVHPPGPVPAVRRKLK